MAKITKLRITAKDELDKHLEALLASKAEIDGYVLMVHTKESSQFVHFWENQFDLAGRMHTLANDLTSGTCADTDGMEWPDEGED